MSATRSANGHSATVRMQLFVNGQVLKIAQIGPRFLMLDHPISYPPSEAEVLMSVDGREERWRVRLPDGISVVARTTAISASGSQG